MNTHLKMTNRVNFLANSIAKSLLCAALVTPLVLTSTWVNAEAIQQPFSIPAGDLGSVISRFAANTGAVVYFDSKLTKGKKTTGLNGSFTILSGLTQLLNGSGLKVIQESDGSYLVVKDTNTPMTLSTLKIKSSSTSNNATEGSNSYIITKMTTATKMNLAVLDTPQSISVVTSAEMEDFNLTSINDVLENTVGITVEKMESDRTQFTSRGFEINNFLIDGLSLPLNYSYQYGDINMAIYDHVEVTRGATGLTSANGNPSATVNMIRKRPTDEFNAAAKLSVGSWNSKIATADVGGAVNNDKSIRARAIVDVQNAESYLDRYETDSNLLSVIVETDISDNSLLAGGFTRYEDNNKGSQWGGIPAFDGVDYDISTNASSDWTYRDVVTTDAFIELTNTLANNWQLKSTYSYKDIEQDAELMNLWVYDDVLKIDGVQAYELSSKEHVLNLTLNGDYQLFNRDNEFVLGLDLAKRNVKETSDYDNDILGTAVDLTTWDGSTATPVYDDRNDGTDYNEEQTALFAATNIHVLKKLNLLLGSRISNWELEGTGYWDASLDSDDKGVFTPYAGLVYKHTDTLSVYASYTTTFKPQSYIDENANYLDPTEGVNYEVGVKSLLLDDRLSASFAVFTTEQDNVASWAGSFDDGTGRAYYSTEDGVTTAGFEVEISGSLTNTIEASIGYSSMTIEDSEGEDTQTYIPTKTAKVNIVYQPEFITGLKVGASMNWKESTNIAAWYGSAEQSAYALVNLMANYQVNKNIKLSLNIDNVTDKKYYGSLIKPYITYGQPRNVTASLAYQF